MATKALETNFTLNQSEAMEILRAPRRTIKESDIFNDIKQSSANKIKHASSILDSRK
ncbi:hypothetical protein [Sporosarcina sp. FSL K6-1508]|uniref:hypothetical protein n=1 Tax=Sporosarcina sp. FSL K6-1508 TaxID=2921553 RepID=UPI0030F673AA